MRDIIKNIIEKIIIPKFGELTYHVVGTNHFPRSIYETGYGYIVYFENIPKKLHNELGKEVAMILEMLGLKHVSYVYEKGDLEVYGFNKD
jgi:hypothetical protein